MHYSPPVSADLLHEIHEIREMHEIREIHKIERFSLKSDLLGLVDLTGQGIGMVRMQLLLVTIKWVKETCVKEGSP